MRSIFASLASRLVSRIANTAFSGDGESYAVETDEKDRVAGRTVGVCRIQYRMQPQHDKLPNCRKYRYIGTV